MVAMASHVHTVTTLADACRVRRHCVLHIIRSRGIKPISRAGNCDLYDAAAEQTIREALAKRGGRNNDDQ